MQSLNEHVQLWAGRNNAGAVDVAGALIEMSAQNAVNCGVSRRDWRDQCADAFARAGKTVKRGNPALQG